MQDNLSAIINNPEIAHDKNVDTYFMKYHAYKMFETILGKLKNNNLLIHSMAGDWMDIKVWDQVGNCDRTDVENETKEVVRRSSRIEERDIKGKDRYE